MTTPPFEDMIRDAIIDRFFAPIPVMETVWKQSPDGSGSYQTFQPGYQNTPMQIVASEIYKAKMQEITAAVLERITLNDITDAVVPKIVANFVKTFDTGDNSWKSPGEDARRKMNDMVWQRVADEFGKQAVAFLQRTGGLQPVLGAVVEE